MGKRQFLDSPEQGLLTIPLWSDIIPRAGGTMVAPDGIPHVAKFLAAHPEGVMNGQPGNVLNFDYGDLIEKCEVFHEMTGEVGDVGHRSWYDATPSTTLLTLSLCPSYRSS
jgi:hypothetical protein